MARVRQKNTEAELKLRSALHALGLRYRLHVMIVEKPRRVADLVFPGPRVAVFVDGCFWHGCPVHGTLAKRNASFWQEKIKANKKRDTDTNVRAQEIGWHVVRVWAHEVPEVAARRIALMIRIKSRSTKK